MRGLQAMQPKLIRHDTFTYVTTSTYTVLYPVIIAENNFLSWFIDLLMVPLVQHIIRILTDRMEFSKLEESFVFKLLLLKCICAWNL